MTKDATKIGIGLALLLASFLSIGCKTASTTNPVAPSLTEPITILTDVSTEITNVESIVTQLGATGVLDAPTLATIQKDLGVSEGYVTSALTLLEAGDTADAKTAIQNLGTALIQLNNDGDLGFKDAATKATFDTAVIAAEILLNSVNL